MQVKVFEAKDMASGLKMVKEALGPDALILSTRTVRRGTFGVMGKPVMEITAAIDNAWQEPAAGAPPAPKKERQPFRPPAADRDNDITYAELWSDSQPPQPAAVPRLVAEKPEIHRELAELRSMVKGLSSRITGLDAASLRRPYVEPEFAKAQGQLSADPVVAYLAGYGLNTDTAQVLARFTRDTLGKASHLDSAELTAILKSAMARLFTTGNLFDHKPVGRRCLSLIGPTGVGKTTTLAKIAAQYLSRFGGRIALITIDTYRIAAVEQLKVYGEIMRLPVEVVIKPDELDRALAKFNDFDLVLIDTAGRSPRNGHDLEELGDFLRPHPTIENHLLLSATTRERELEDTIDRFSFLPISNFIFSKIDECDQLGVLLNIHFKNDTPISFLTNGQRVPEDLLFAKPGIIADLIMNDLVEAHHG